MVSKLAMVDQAPGGGALAPPVPLMAGSGSLERALDLLALRKHEEALLVLEPLCAAAPANAIARAYLGVTYLRLTRVADARVELEAAVALAPNSFICRSRFGEYLARLGFYDQALVQLDLAMAAGAPSSESKHALLELRQFCKTHAAGLIYRDLRYPPNPFRRLFGRLKPTAPAAAKPLEG